MLFAKGVAYPLHAARQSVDQKDVEAARRIWPARKIKPCRGEQTGALAFGDAFTRAAEAKARAHPNFGEHYRSAVLGDEVDLAQTAAPVALDHAHPRALEELRAELFGSQPGGVHGTLNGTMNAPVDRMASGTLYVVGTPIGNLADASPRSIEVLRQANIVACEDTRVTRTLLARYGIEARTVTLHEHNERAAAAKLISALREGKSVALVSDAGTPALSDPGAALVEQAHRAGIRVSPIPGPSAAAAAFSASGFASERFLFVGFLPSSGAARRKALEALDLPWPVILYEAPHRIAETLEDLAARFGPQREIAIARELTKKFEEVTRLPLGLAQDWLASHAHRTQGEFALVLAPGEEKLRPALDAEQVLAVLLEALAPSEAARLAARITGAPKNALYRKALKRSK